MCRDFFEICESTGATSCDGLALKLAYLATAYTFGCASSSYMEVALVACSRRFYSPQFCVHTAHRVFFRKRGLQTLGENCDIGCIAHSFEVHEVA